MAVVTELVTVFSFKGSLGKLDKFQSGVKTSLKYLGGFALASGAAVAGIVGFTSAALTSAEAIGQLSNETGNSVEALQQYGFVASQSGSSIDALNSSVSGLSAKIGEAAQNGSAEFSRLGINVRKSTGEVKSSLEVFDELGGRFKSLGLSLQEQRKFTDALGIDKSLLTLLGKTSSEIDTLKQKAASLGVLTKKETDSVIGFKDSLSALGFGAKAVQQQFALAMAPEIKNMAEGFTDLLIENKTLIKDGLEKTVSVAGGIIETVIRLTTFIYDLIDSTVGWKVALIGIGAVLAVTLSPIYLIVAGIVAVIAIIDDLIVAFNGGKSVIRDFFLEFFGWDIQPFLQDFVQSFKNVVAMVKSIISPLFDFLGDAFSQAMDVIKVISGGIGSLFGGSSDEAGQGGSSVAPMSLAAGSSSGAGLSSNRTDINQDVNINIETNNPEQAGRAVSDALQNEYRTAAQQTGRGGR